MYKLSQFIVNREKKDTVLLYSTLTTSLIEIEKKIYNDIFIEQEFDKYLEETKALYNMGFIIDADYDELEFLKTIREQAIAANNSSPTYYIIAPTTDCNARCYYCFEKGAEKCTMTSEIATAVAKYIIANHDEENLIIQWFGGEPLLETETITLVSKLMKDNDIKFKSKIITNGYLLTEDVINKALKEWNVETVQITIDDLAENYNKIKNYIYDDTDAFSVVMANIEKGLEIGLKIRIRINFNPAKYKQTIDIVKYLKEKFSYNKNFFMYLAPIDSDSKNIPSITEKFETEEKHPIIALLDAEEKYCGLGNFDINNIDEDEDKRTAILRKYYLTPIPTSCYGGCESAVTIDALGDIYVCHRLLGRKEYASGNVFTGKEYNDVYMHYSNTEITEECCNCNLLPICQGGCKHRAFKYGKERACISIKGAINQLIERVANELE